MFAALALLVAAVFSAPAQSQAVSDCVLPPIATGERPNSGDGPTEVGVGMVVLDVLGVDDVGQQINIDMVVVLKWLDPRLASLDGCRFQYAQVWTPRIVLLNSSNLRAKAQNQRDQVAIGPGGSVTYIQRFSGDISTYHNLHRFPFDKQEFVLSVGSLTEDDTRLILRPLGDIAILSENLNIADWRVKGLMLAAGEEEVAELGEVRSIVTATISADRISQFYIFKVILPLIFIVAMSWAVYWVPPQKYDFQIGLGATSMLTVIAFQFAISNNLPKLGYFTLMDSMVFWAIFIVFLAVLNAMLTAVLVTSDRLAVA